MLIQRVAVPAIAAASLALLSLSPAAAQYYGPPCTPFPLSWPVCVAGAAVGTAVAIASAPFAPYYYYGSSYYAPTPRGSYYQPLNRPSPSDHVARQLNRQELRGY